MRFDYMKFDYMRFDYMRLDNMRLDYMRLDYMRLDYSTMRIEILPGIFVICTKVISTKAKDVCELQIQRERVPDKTGVGIYQSGSKT